MWWIIGAIAVFCILTVFGMCKVSGRISRMEEMEELRDMTSCHGCLHYRACQSWIRDGKTLYYDFFYSTGDCPYFEKYEKNVTQNTGKWITDEDDVYWGNSVKKKYCSACGKRPHFDRETGKYVLTDFCHNCGADMRN